VKPWHSMTSKDALAALGSGRDGLSSEEASRRLEEHGPNRLESPTKPSPLRIFISQFRDYMIFVLIFAAIIAFLAGEATNAYVILGIILLVALIGFVQEYRAERSMEALRVMVAPEADVFRDGRMVSLPAESLVPGDVIFLEAGDKAPADGHILEETSLKLIEASLTGESLPVKKSTEVLPEDTDLADRMNMVFMGTIVAYGNCKVVVTATGRNTELGKISGLIVPKQEEPPLKAKLDHLAKRQAILVFIISALVFALSVSRGFPVLDTLVTAIALAVAGVPEALPFVVTLALAYGTQIMARKSAIIRNLPAVETLGSTTVICTDKTGTLTQNEMTVREIRTFRMVEVTGSGYEPVGSFLQDGKAIDPREDDIALLLRIGVLSNNADVVKEREAWKVLGDPTEGALIVAARKAGLLEEVKEGFVEVAEHPFDSERKRMTTVNRFHGENGFTASMKGAPELVVERCAYLLNADGVRPMTDEDRASILSSSDEMAERALRVLAFAWRPLEDAFLERDLVEKELIFVGLVGIMDPPRKEAMEAINICKQAGIRPVMITGDHRITAKAIGQELGIGQGEVIEGSELDRMTDVEIEKVSIFARVTAEHKVRIVKAFKAHGEVVAMTGDGVNDAPALKAADIGVAMGGTGTEVAKEASDMVITDDNFATIVAAVEEGRRIYGNIRKGTSYLLSVSFAELMTLFFATVAGLPIPLLATQILWINVVTEEFPAVGLSVEEADPRIMRRKPRDPQEPILTRSMQIYTLGIAVAIVAGSLGLYLFALQQGEDLEYARTLAFAALGTATLYNAYASKSLEESVLKINPLSNKKLLAGIAAAILALLAAIYLPFMQPLFDTVPLRMDSWLAILGVSFLVVIVSEVLKRGLPGLRHGME
jgi:Ca2+-transporting ATPase